MIKKTLFILGIAILLLSPAKLFATETGYRTAPVRVTGKRLRKQVRRLLYEEYLYGDKLRVYNKYGYCRHRLRSSGYGEKRERWLYYDLGLEYVFDQDNKLVAKRRFFPEHKRERQERAGGKIVR